MGYIVSPFLLALKLSNLCNLDQNIVPLSKNGTLIDRFASETIDNPVLGDLSINVPDILYVQYPISTYCSLGLYFDELVHA